MGLRLPDGSRHLQAMPGMSAGMGNGCVRHLKEPNSGRGTSNGRGRARLRGAHLPRSTGSLAEWTPSQRSRDEEMLTARDPVTQRHEQAQAQEERTEEARAASCLYPAALSPESKTTSCLDFSPSLGSPQWKQGLCSALQQASVGGERETASPNTAVPGGCSRVVRWGRESAPRSLGAAVQHRSLGAHFRFSLGRSLSS